MSDAAPSPISRESFFAIYWDHARELPRYTTCLLAKFSKEYSFSLLSLDWDRLDESDRKRLRAVFLEMMEWHDHNRRAALKQREALKPTEVKTDCAQKVDPAVLQSGDRPPLAGAPLPPEAA